MQALLFLLDALISFFTTLFLLRFFMQLNRVSFANPLGHFVVQLTNPLLRPLRRIIPAWGGLDLASLVIVLILQCLRFVPGLLLNPSSPADPANLALMILWYGALGCVRQAIWMFIIILIAQAILSWVNPHSPIAPAISQMTRPLLRPIQRILPPIANIDLSPLVAILLLQALQMLL